MRNKFILFTSPIRIEDTDDITIELPQGWYAESTPKPLNPGHSVRHNVCSKINSIARFARNPGRMRPGLHVPRKIDGLSYRGDTHARVGADAFVRPAERSDA
jgi:hypothetical protein